MRAGHHYVIKLTPTVHATSENFRHLGVEKRGCRYHHEKMKRHGGMFKGYTKKSCVLECSVRNAYKTGSCCVGACKKSLT